jgi:hydrogenase-4 component F
MAELLVGWPILWALVVLAAPSNRWRPRLLPVGALIQLLLVVQALLLPDPVQSSLAAEPFLKLDPLGRILLPLIGVLFFLCACYAPGYLAHRQQRDNRVLCTCLMLSLGMMTLVILSHHLGLMWVAMEATTLITAPGLYFNHNPRSIEATWKYLLLCSVGIALALLGSLFLAYAAFTAGQHSSLLFEDLVRIAPALSRPESKPWLHAALVLLLVGYGTKMGLAPMHTWKPDAYGEAPGVIGALLAGGLTNCSFLAILRFVQIAYAAQEGPYVQRLLIILGLSSMTLAAAFMARQRDFKRMLAYSSVEHMGILALGVGIGGSATYAALLHVVANALTKGVLFLSAGNIHRAYDTKATAEVTGVLRRLPISGAFFLLGFLAITGSPPFAPFVSEYSLLAAAFREGHYVLGGLFAFLLLIVFFGFGSVVTSMVFGQSSPAASNTNYRDGVLTIGPIVAFTLLILVLGVWMPKEFADQLRSGANFLQQPTAAESKDIAESDRIPSARNSGEFRYERK